MSRCRPLVAALVAVLALLAAAPVVGAAPVTPVLDGGELIYEGTGFAKQDMDDDEMRHHETTNLSWSTHYVMPSPYPGTPRLSYDDNDDLKAFQWQDALGDFSSSTSVLGQDEDGNWTKWSPVNSCHGTAKELLTPPNGLWPWANAAGGAWWTMASGTQSASWEGSCADPDGPGGTSPSMSGQLVDNIAAKWTAPAHPPVGQAQISKDVDQGYATRDCDIAGIEGCTQSVSVQGTLTLKCLLCVTAIDFQHPDEPSGNEVPVPAAGTTDGNIVKVTVKITNTSPKAFSSAVGLREATSGRVITSADWEGAGEIYTFAPGATKTLHFSWDTDGFAWEGGEPHSDRKLQVLTALGGGQADIKVLPRPMILVHGWNADSSTWDDIKPQVPALVHPGYAGRVFAVGDGQAIGAMNTDPDNGWAIERNARAERDYIRDVQADLDARHVDLVAHSMGGLISRMYLQEQMPEATVSEVPPLVPRPVARHLVMLGTPNEGSPCADLISFVKDGIPTWQLRPDFAVSFNKLITQTKGAKLSVMAGDWEERTCQSPEHGDLVVTVPSAWHTFGDVAKTYINHLDMTGSTAIMGGWVKQHVAEDPDASGNVTQRKEGPDERPLAAASVRASGASAALSGAAPVPQQVAMVRSVTVPAGGSVDVPLPASPSGPLTAGFVAAPEIASALVTPGGATADAVAAGSDAARQPMRFHRAEAPGAGTWVLRLSQAGGDERTVDVVVALEGSPLRLTAAVADGALIADFHDGDAPVEGAAVTAAVHVDGAPDRTLTLLDDGAHGDGAADDGRYGAALESADGQDVAVSVRGEHGGDVRYAGTAALAGAPAPGPGDGGDDDDGGGTDGGGTPGDGTTDKGAPGPSTPPGDDPGPAPDTGGDTSGAGDHGSPTPGPRRSKPKVAARVQRLRGHRGWMVRGTVTTPRGTSCTGGRVTVALKVGRRVRATAKARVAATCAFRARLKAPRGARGKAVITVRFGGTATLAPATGAQRRVVLR
ncbi:MAG TPA: choice-of-anchor X domain-containing protein [Baekduia sp.]|nr:choice-of-anchor X domain-containing protein [Baekduia sp.]